MNKLREKIYNQCIQEGYKIASFISKKSLIYTDENLIEEGAIIFPNVFIGPNVKVGKCTIISASVSISHDTTIGDFTFFSTGGVVGGFTDINKYSFIGLHSTLKNDIVIKEGTLVGSNANIIRDTEPYCVYVGNPAKKLEGKKSIDIVKV